MKISRNLFRTFQGKIIITFIILILALGISMFYSSANMYKDSVYNYIDMYFQDITSQVNYNINSRIKDAEDLTFEILSNNTIQSNLYKVDKLKLSNYDMQKLYKNIEKEIEPKGLYDSNIVSLSVITDDMNEISIKKLEFKSITKLFSKQEVYNAQGTTIWGMSDNTNISVSRAIYSLINMKPIGFINIVYKNSYIDSIIKNTSLNYDNNIYLVDSNYKIICSNDKNCIGSKFDYPQTIDSKSPEYDNINKELSLFYKSGYLDNGWNIIVTVPVKEINNNIDEYKNKFLIISAIVIAISLILCIIIIKVNFKPMKVLQKAMRKFGEGEHDLRIKRIQEDEIGRMSKEYNNMADNIVTLLKKVLNMEISKKQAEIEFLKMQINPHFLYNTLDTINWLAIMNNNKDVSEISIALANLLRSNVKGEAEISVSEEMAIVNNYLLIQHYRFADKIIVHKNIDDKCMKIQIPKFILQPIIENAIIHGLEPKIENGNIYINIYCDEINNESLLVLEIIDDGVGMTEAQIEEFYTKCKMDSNITSIGLYNVYKRLKLLYDDKAKFSLSNEKPGVKVRLEIPLP